MVFWWLVVVLTHLFTLGGSPIAAIVLLVATGAVASIRISERERIAARA